MNELYDRQIDRQTDKHDFQAFKFIYKFLSHTLSCQDIQRCFVPCIVPLTEINIANRNVSQCEFFLALTMPQISLRTY